MSEPRAELPESASRPPLLTDAQIAALSPAERRRLVLRLLRPADDAKLPPRAVLRRARRARLSIMVAGTAVLVPWIVYLALTLPPRYVANHWTATWVGFDVALVVMMAATVAFGLGRRLLVVLTGFTTGVMLAVDAWFDVMTSAPGDAWAALASAALAELPLAALLTYGTVRILRRIATACWLIEPGQSLLQVRAPAALFEDRTAGGDTGDG